MNGRRIGAALATSALVVTMLVLVSAPAQATTFVNSGAITIPNGAPGTTDGPANPFPSGINVTGLPAVTTDVNVTINGLSHTWPDDLDIVLRAPSGRQTILVTDAGGDGNVTGINLTFDDAAGTFIPPDGPMSSGTFRPTDSDEYSFGTPSGALGTSMATFNGADPNGVWSLWVYDDSTSDVGQIASGWALNITAAPNAPTITAISPSDGYAGDLVTLTGTAFTGATAVTFNGVAAQYTVNSDTQITATVPNGASAGVIAVTTSGGTGSSAMFFVVRHRRTISLDVSGRKARGRVD